jgi:hypothetical protein
MILGVPKDCIVAASGRTCVLSTQADRPLVYLGSTRFIASIPNAVMLGRKK